MTYIKNKFATKGEYAVESHVHKWQMDHICEIICNNKYAGVYV